MRTAAATLLLLLCAVFAQAQQAPAEWIKYTSPEGRYSVRLPKEPQLSTQDTTDPTGAKVKQYMAAAADANSLSMIGYFDYGADQNFSFDKARDGMLSAVKGTLLAESSISLGGHPGRELRILAKGPKDLEFISRARFYDVDRRIYVVQFIFLKSSEDAALVEKAGKFFDSFEVRTAK